MTTDYYYLTTINIQFTEPIWGNGCGTLNRMIQ